MSDGEKEPLLQRQQQQHNDSLKLSILRQIRYGTSQRHAEKQHAIIPKELRVVYTWSDLNVFVSEGSTRICFRKPKKVDKHILKNVSGVAYPGELLAILGSSGAGKSTLLNALTFRNQSHTIITGLRCANGSPLSENSMTSQSSYVQQDDLFYPNLTVFEHLKFHAMVRMDRSIPMRQRMERVNSVIEELSLKKCRNSLISVISCGERKRLAFAAEVLTNPLLLFCDEPTSGLDAFMALNVVELMKKLAITGRTVVATIHQPSSQMYALFDKVIYMSEGRVAFQGTPDEADVFFTGLKAPCPQNFSPADYYIGLLAVIPEQEESCRQAVAMICNNFEKSEFGEKIQIVTSSVQGKIEMSYNDFWITDEINCTYKNSWCMQFRAVLWRSFLFNLKEPLLVKVRIWQTLITALVVGILYFNQQLNENGVMNINGALFLFLTTMTFQNLYAVVNIFCSEYQIFLRENGNGMYRTDVYYLSKTLADVPLFTIIPVLYVSVCYFMIGLNPDISTFFFAVLIAVLVTHVVVSFGYLISCATTSVSMAMSVGPPLIIPFLLFGGFFLNVASIPVYLKWLSYFSWFRYGFEALMINQWSNISNITCMEGSPACPPNGAVVLEIYNFVLENFYTNIMMLVMLILLFRSLAFACLLLRTLNK